MVNGEALLRVIRYNHFSIKELASIMQLTPITLRTKIKTGIFQSNELEMFLKILKFPGNVDPFEIFFDTYDSSRLEPVEYEEMEGDG